MRVVTVYHRDDRGKVEYGIYESEELLRVSDADAKICNNLWEAEKGDYVVSQNGWVVPLIQVTELRNKYYKYKSQRRVRRNDVIYKVYHFPQQKICVRYNKIADYKFNYMPKNSKNIAGDGVVNRMYELSVRKIEWAQLVANGIEPATATERVYPSVWNKNSLTKTLLLNDKIYNFIMEKSGSSMKRAYKRIGVDEDYVADLLKSITENKKESWKLRMMAMKVILETFK